MKKLLSILMLLATVATASAQNRIGVAPASTNDVFSGTNSVKYVTPATLAAATKTTVFSWTNVSTITSVFAAEATPVSTNGASIFATTYTPASTNATLHITAKMQAYAAQTLFTYLFAGTISNAIDASWISAAGGPVVLNCTTNIVQTNASPQAVDIFVRGSVNSGSGYINTFAAGTHLMGAAGRSTIIVREVPKP